MARQTIEERIEQDSVLVPESGCRIWLGSLFKKDHYGRISYHGKWQRVHRIAWTLKHGPLPDGMHVLHRCDVRCCVSVHHLFLGTNDDNIADKVAKGRQLRGETIRNSRFTEEQVLSIRADQRSIYKIAADYNVNPVTVWYIRVRHTWRHI